MGILPYNLTLYNIAKFYLEIHQIKIAFNLDIQVTLKIAELPIIAH